MKQYIRRGMLSLLITCLALGNVVPARAGSLSETVIGTLQAETAQPESTGEAESEPALPANSRGEQTGTNPLETDELAGSQAGAVTGTLSNGVLTFSGSGEISENYLCENFAVDDDGCFAAIEKVVVNRGITGIAATAFVGCGKLTEVTLPDSLVSIGEDAFAWCTSLTTINIPARVTTLGAEAFRGCTSLKTVALPSNLRTVSRQLFRDCTALESVTFPSALTAVDESAFSGCTALKTVSLPDGVARIGAYAFQDCTALTRITLPPLLTKLENGLFYGCEKLQEVTLPDGITAIGTVQPRDDYDYGISGAFEGCTSLKTINLPAGLTVVGDQTFHNCSALTDVDYGGTPRQWEEVSVGMYNAELIHAVMGETALKVGSTTVDNRHFYTFTPTKDYYYQFTSLVPAGSAELCIYEKADGDWEWLDQDVPCPEAGDPADHYNFELVLLLEKGHTYYLEMDLTGAFDRDSFTLNIREAVPILSKVKNVADGVEISWKHLVEYDSEMEDPPHYYRVYRKDMSLSDPTWVKVKDCITNKCVDTKAVSGTNYVYTVRAVTPTAAGTRTALSSYNSTGLSIRHLSCMKPTLTNVSNGIKISWSKVAGAEGYLVYQNVDGVYKRLAKITGNTTLSYIHTGASTNGKAYKYTVKAYKGSVYGAYKNTSTYRLTAVSQYAPTNLSTRKMRVKWTKNSKAGGYQIQYATASSFSGAKTVTVGSSALYKDITGLTKGKTYYVRVRAYKTNSSGTRYYSGWSPTKSVTIRK